MRVYISGPMTGYPKLNFPAFEHAEHLLRAAGHEPVSPARHPVQESWVDYMRLDLVDVVTSDAVAVLPDWEASRGAVLEVHVAQALGMQVRPLARWVS